MSNLSTSLSKGLASITKDFTKAKHQRGAGRLSTHDYGRVSYGRLYELSIKDAAYKYMRQAYDMASGQGSYPANARQILYATRPLVLKATDGRCWENSAYFTQTLLPDYMEDHPNETDSWDVVFDARGHLVEPHTRHKLGLGTLEVRSYIMRWKDAAPSEKLPVTESFDPRWQTVGPENRYKFALFIEKEGFTPLIERADIKNRFDMAVFSTKGMSTTSARQLVDELSCQDVTILIAHDFDDSGLTIARTLASNTRRYIFTTRPNFVDIGLRLADVTAMSLQSEPVTIRQNKSPRRKFEEYGQTIGVTKEELEFLWPEQVGRGIWQGKRVELNAMTSPQFIEWLERKLIEHGVEKVIPDQETLAVAWRRAKRLAEVNAITAKVVSEINQKEYEVPADLTEQLHAKLKLGSANS